MDAKVGDWVVTPRIGKPVEVQALWLNALAAGSQHSERWADVLERGRRAFAERFWNASGAACSTSSTGTIGPDRRRTLRPNQIFAVGGLPFAVLDGKRARQVVDAVEQQPVDPARVCGRSRRPSRLRRPLRRAMRRARDGSYHQGTVWPWLAGPFVGGLGARARRQRAEARREAREKFLAPLLAHMDQAGLGHIGEIADGDPPHTPRGCPFQAWSVGEALRLDRVVLAE